MVLKEETLPEANLEVSDDCDENPTYEVNDVVLSSTASLQVILREFLISDACGNTLTLQEQYNVTLVNPAVRMRRHAIMMLTPTCWTIRATSVRRTKCIRWMHG